jgi:hypothetical protein
MDAMAEDIQHLADDSEADPLRSRLQVDARKWLMSKLMPKKYGDKVGVEHSGTIGVHDALAEALKRERDMNKTNPNAGA